MEQERADAQSLELHRAAQSSALKTQQCLSFFLISWYNLTIFMIFEKFGSKPYYNFSFFDSSVSKEAVFVALCHGSNALQSNCCIAA